MTPLALLPKQRCPASGPLLSLDDLLALLFEHGASFARATPQPARPLTERWYRRIFLSKTVEIWAIQWPSDTGLPLHDHGGSFGAFFVVEGVLTEGVLHEGASLRRRRVGAGQGSSFDASQIHSVANVDRRTVLSVHAYSPPLRDITYFNPAERPNPARAVIGWQ